MMHTSANQPMRSPIMGRHLRIVTPAGMKNTGMYFSRKLDTSSILLSSIMPDISSESRIPMLQMFAGTSTGKWTETASPM